MEFTTTKPYSVSMEIVPRFHATLARNRGDRVQPSNGKRHSVLVIEDDTALLKLLGEILGTAGFDVRFARNREELRSEMNRRPCADIALLDLSLPDMDGYEVLERMRAHPTHGSLPVIIMTGKSQAHHMARGLALGADGYVTKPFKVSAMVNAVNTVLGLE
jgi:two-component system OmpR family response regulator